MRKLVIKEKVFSKKESFPIVDEAGNEVYLIEQETSTRSYRADIKSINREILATVERENFSLGPKYIVSLAKGGSFTIKREPGLLKQSLIAEFDNETLSFSGDLWKYNFQILNESSEIIGAVSLEVSGGSDTYNLSIYDENYEQEMLGILIAVKNIIDLQRNTNVVVATSSI